MNGVGRVPVREGGAVDGDEWRHRMRSSDNNSSYKKNKCPWHHHQHPSSLPSLSPTPQDALSLLPHLPSDLYLPILSHLEDHDIHHLTTHIPLLSALPTFRAILRHRARRALERHLQSHAGLGEVVKKGYWKGGGLVLRWLEEGEYVAGEGCVKMVGLLERAEWVMVVTRVGRMLRNRPSVEELRQRNILPSHPPCFSHTLSAPTRHLNMSLLKRHLSLHLRTRPSHRDTLHSRQLIPYHMITKSSQAYTSLLPQQRVLDVGLRRRRLVGRLGVARRYGAKGGGEEEEEA